MRSPRCARLLLLLLLLPLLLTPPAGDAAIITGACKNDPQCGEGMCCAVSIWVKSIRICTPMGKVGDSCHPMSHKVPYMGERKHHTCPCLPDLACSRNSSKRYTCSARK
nr:prokineticin-2 isoform X13 [Odocoileus virginianus texanus]